MFEIKTVQVPKTFSTYDNYNASDYVDELIEKAQLQNIGSGAYAKVYSRNDLNVVFKVGDAEDNSGYMSYLKALSQVKTKNPYFPKIYEASIVRGRNSYDSVLVVAMERLRELEYVSLQKLRPVIDWFDNNAWHIDRLFELSKLLGIKYPIHLSQALRVLQKAYKTSGGSFDLHAGNFMLRGEQLVITDPIA